MRTNSIARRYAEAAFDVANDKLQAEVWLPQLEALSSRLSQPDFAEVLRSPRISNEQKVAAIEEAFSSIPAELKNLLRLLVHRNRVELVPAITAAFSRRLDDLLGRVDAEVTSARPLTDEELEAVRVHLGKRTGKTVSVHQRTDPRLIGGVIMRVGDALIDASVATRLERLRQRMA